MRMSSAGSSMRTGGGEEFTCPNPSLRRLSSTAQPHRFTAQFFNSHVRPETGLPFRIVKGYPREQAYKPFRLNIPKRRNQCTHPLHLQFFVRNHGSVLLTKAVG